MGPTESDDEVAWMLWGKADPGAAMHFRSPESQGAAWHPLICHSIDVAAVAEVLLRGGLPPGLVGRMAGAMGLDEEDAAAWLCLLVALHDIGKISPGFQNKWEPGASRLRQAGLDVQPPADAAPHGVISVIEVSRLLIERHGFDMETATRVARAVGAHHGEFPTDGEANRSRTPRELGRSLGWARARASLLDYAERFAEIAGRPRATLPHDHAFFVLLAGLTSVADWIGSMAEVFEYVPSPASFEAYATLARQRAAQAVARVGWRGFRAPAARGFEALFGRAPWPLHTAIEGLVCDLRGPSLVLIEAPMGEGKTEAALLLSEALGAQVGHGGMFIGLPTQATSNQMLGRVRRFLDAAYPDKRKNLHLCHGDAALSDAYQELRARAIYGGRRGAADAVVAEEWFAKSKRSLLAPFAVGTIDQALLGVLRVRHGFVRLFGVGPKTVILDEIHAYDTYTSTLVDRLVAWLGAMGASVVLLSATLPARRRAEIVKAFGGRSAAPAAAVYPRVTWVTRGGVGVRSIGCRRPSLEVRIEGVGPDRGDVALALSAAIQGGGCAAWICNTVDRAQKAFVALRSLREAGRIDPGTGLHLLHARMPFEDRQDREQAAEALFGPAGHGRPARAVLVGTQVLEQSLDLDFDVMVSDLAPIDLLLQRSGRLHRHDRGARPPGLERPRLLIVRPEDEAAAAGPSFGGIAAVYEQAVMLKTWLALRARASWILPDDIEPLVESVYGEGSGDQVPAGMVARLVELERDFERRRQEETAGAKLRVLPAPDHPDDIFADLRMPFEEDSPDIHRSLQAVTRLGDPSVEVVCLFGDAAHPTLDAAGTRPASLAEPSDLRSARALLRRSVSLSHKGVVAAIEAVDVPAGWERSAHLRRHRPLFFGRGPVRVGHHAIRLDDELGVVIEAQSKEAP